MIGRQREFAAVVRLLSALPSGPGAVLLEGEAGIGKTLVWQAGVEEARAREIHVLRARPAGSEVRLSFAGLGDILGGTLEETLPELPEPQRDALRAALLLADADVAQPDQRAVGLAFLGVLRLLAHDRSVLVAVDDLQWLDRPSGRVLEFALRRLDAEPVGFLAAIRGPPGAAVPFELDRAFSERVERIPLPALSLGALYELLRTRLGLGLPRPALLRVYEASGGNPFYALEIGRELERHAVDLAPVEPLPIPAGLRPLLRDRIERLSHRTRSLLLSAAVLSDPTVPLLAEVHEQAEADLERALRAGVIELEEERVRFSHPLLAAATRAEASPLERREAHRRVAEVVADDEERARHLALAAMEPDGAIAAALDGAARKAAARGAPEAAAELNDQAARLTPPDEVDAARRRRIEAARLSFVAGDTARARRLFDELLRELPPGRERARVLVLLANVFHQTEGMDAAMGACEQALAEPIDEPGLKAEIHATFAYVADEDNRRRAEHAQAALRLLSEVEPADPRVEATALVAFACAQYYLGRGLERDAMERAIALEEAFESPRVADRASTVLGEWLKYTDDFDAARRHLEAAHRAALEEGDDSSLPDILAHLAELELWAGKWDLADQYAGKSLKAAEQTGQEASRAINLYGVALVGAHRARVEQARGHAEEALAVGERIKSPWVMGISLWVLGFLDLSLGDLPAVDRHLTRADEIGESIGLVEPGQWRFHADHVEALVGLGELERAEALRDRLEERGRAVDRPWALATAARCRGLLLEARGDRDGALAAFTEALREHERLPVPFERARTLLALGSVQRRANQKRVARESLDEALAIFDELGAPLWAEKARVELGRIGGRAVARRGELTATERAIAELVAAGQTNDEVAAALSLSPRTVQWNLSKIYRKVGVRSRTELAAALPGVEQARER